MPGYVPKWDRSFPILGILLSCL